MKAFVLATLVALSATLGGCTSLVFKTEAEFRSWCASKKGEVAALPHDVYICLLPDNQKFEWKLTKYEVQP